MATPVTALTARINKVRHHPNADRLDLGEVLGWQVVVGRDNYKDGDMVVFFEPDTILPVEMADSLGVRQHLRGKNKDRVGQARLRGEASFGLVVTPADTSWMVGLNVAEHYGATKYVPPLRATCSDAETPHSLFQKYTDIQNLRSHPDVFTDGEPVIATEKIDGTNSRVGWIEMEWMAGSMELRRRFPTARVKRADIGQDKIDALCERDIDIRRFPEELSGRSVYKEARKVMHELGIKMDDLYKEVPITDIDDPVVAANTYWYPLTLPWVRNLLKGVARETGASQVILFGEVFGRGIASGLDELDYGIIGEFGYRAFDLLVNGVYMDYPDFLGVCADYGVQTVPVLYEGPYSIEAIRKVSDGTSTLAGHIREGTVVHPVVERISPAVGRLVMKYLGDTYLLKKKRDFKDS